MILAIPFVLLAILVLVILPIGLLVQIIEVFWRGYRKGSR